MRKAFLVFLGLVIHVNAYGHLVDDPNADNILDRPNYILDEVSNIDRALDRALSILDKAEENIDTLAGKRFFARYARSLKNAELIVPPPGKDFRICIDEPSVLAFVKRNDRNKINICARTAEHRNTKFVAQVLIHETAHVRGISNECTATKVEILAMNYSGEGMAFKNGYWKRCGFDGQER